MSALLTETTRALGLSSTSSAVRTAIGVVAIAVLLLILVGREMVRGELGGERARRMSHLGFVVVPLSLVFVGVVAPRLMDLMR